MKQFLEQVLFTAGTVEITVGRLLLSLLVLVLGFMLDRLILRIKKRNSRKWARLPGTQRLIRYIRIVIWVVFTGLLLGAIGMPLGEVLDATLFKIGPSKKEENVTFRITIWSLIKVGIIMFGAKAASWGTENLLNRSQSAEKTPTMEEGRLFALTQIIKYVIYVLAVLWALSAAGINITVLLAGSAALLVGIGLGIQNIFNDIISGIVILFEGIVELNDVVEVDGRVGRVVNIKLRTTEIITRAGLSVLVANSKFTNGSVINYSHTSQDAMFRVQVGVAYGSDVSLVRKLLLECAEDHGDVLKRPKPDVFFQDFGNSALIFELLFWTRRTFERERVMSDLRFAIDAAFRKNSIHIPFPQRDLHVVSDFRYNPGGEAGGADTQAGAQVQGSPNPSD